MVAGVVVGFGIGIVVALLGVAGGELLIPTLMLLFGADIKLAGSLSLAVSLPTMIVGFTRYSQDRSFAVLGQNRRFVLVMAAGSIVGSFIGPTSQPHSNDGAVAVLGSNSGDFCRESLAALKGPFRMSIFLRQRAMQGEIATSGHLREPWQSTVRGMFPVSSPSWAIRRVSPLRANC